LEQCTSPITGIVHSVHCLNPDATGLKIYGASTSKIPRNKPLVGTDDFVQYSLGKGISDAQSRMSAVAEAIERHNAQYDGTETVVFGRREDLQNASISPLKLKQYSARQYAYFRLNHHDTHAVACYHDSIPLHWTPATSMINGVQVWLPLSFCYANTPFDDAQYIRFNSNGNAAGNTLEEAIIQGFLELVERDAVAVWWYNRIQRPAIDLAGLPSQMMQLFKASLASDWDYWVLDLSTDFGIPIVAAISRHKTTQHYRFGFAAHFDIVIAIERAMTELYQLIVAMPGNAHGRFDFDRLEKANYLEATSEPFLKITNFPKPKFDSIQTCIQACREAAMRAGFDLLYLDTTRPCSPLHTVKIFSPGLNFIWPEFGNERLYALPNALNWVSGRHSEDTLNPIELFV
jgi:oxazoline/thiazoline synthase